MKRKPIELSKAYQVFFDSLHLDDIDSLVLAAHDLFNMPILLCDENYRAIAQYPRKKIGVWVWDELLDKAVLENKVVESYQVTYLADKKRFYDPFYQNTGLVKDCPRIFGEIYDQDKVYGHVAVFMFDQPLCETDLAVTQFFIDALKLIMAPRKSRQNISYSNYLSDLLKKDTSPQARNLASRILSPRIPGNYTLMCIPLGSSASARALAEMKLDTIPATYRYSLGTVYQDNLIILFGLMGKENFTAKEKEFFLEVRDNLSFKNSRIGISQPFSSLMEMPDRYLQAVTTAKSIKSGIGFFDEVYPAQLFHLISHHGKVNCLVMKNVLQMKSYDEQNHTDYYRTLRSYCYNKCDNNVCSSELSIHRNTLLYRLNKIEELFGLNLSNKNTFLAVIDSFQLLDAENNELVR